MIKVAVQRNGLQDAEVAERDRAGVDRPCSHAHRCSGQGLVVHVPSEGWSRSCRQRNPAAPSCEARGVSHADRGAGSSTSGGAHAPRRGRPPSKSWARPPYS
eukprot:1667185-Prymnesium_polylepis.2